MKKKPVFLPYDAFPKEFHSLIADQPIFDSSCSEAARVYFIDRDGGYYLKKNAKGRLRKEAEMTAYFHSLGMGVEIMKYLSDEDDWLLTRAATGEDCTHAAYRSDPKRLSETLGLTLRSLHETDPKDCPVQNRTADYLESARRGFEADRFDPAYLPPHSGIGNAAEAWRIVEQNAKFLKSDTLLHGDYWLPNVILDNWRFSAFIDVDGGGVGERHIDLFWGLWSLRYNLKTDAYGNRFLDAYGRDKVNEDVLRIISAIEVFG